MAADVIGAAVDRHGYFLKSHTETHIDKGDCCRRRLEQDCLLLFLAQAVTDKHSLDLVDRNSGTQWEKRPPSNGLLLVAGTEPVVD